MKKMFLPLFTLLFSLGLQARVGLIEDTQTLTVQTDAAVGVVVRLQSVYTGEKQNTVIVTVGDRHTYYLLESDINDAKLKQLVEDSF